MVCTYVESDAKSIDVRIVTEGAGCRPEESNRDRAPTQCPIELK